MNRPESQARRAMTDTPPPPARRPRWIPVAIGVLLALILLGAGLFGAGVYWVSRHVHSTRVDPSTASEAFAQARRRFQGQVPVITLDGDRPIVRSPSSAGNPAPIHTLHILAYTADENRLVHVDVPAWMLRLTRRGRVSIEGLDGLSSVRNRITLRDLERYGPGLLLDATTPDDAQVLIWTD
jgi:hypothetical protein